MDASSTSTEATRSSRRSLQKLWWVALVLAVAGLAFAVELTRIHLRLQSDPSHRSFCNISSTVNCDAVAASSYSMLLGLPLSIWGIFGYVAAIGAAVWGARTNSRAAVMALWMLGAVCVVGAVILAGISAFVLRTWCLFCMCTWVVDVGLFVAVTRLKRAIEASLPDLLEWSRGNLPKAAAVAATGAVALGLAYHGYGDPGDPLAQTAKAASLVSGATKALGKPMEGVDEKGHPYVGAKSPKLVITEFSDYQCPHCARAHEHLRSLVSAYPEAIRVVHRHFPLDNDCNPKIKHVFHTHACYYARLAICAASLGKFWQGNDYLFAHGRDEASVPIESFARAIEVPAAALRDCLANKVDESLKRDVDAGMSSDIDGTPTFFIAGQKYSGELPAEVLRDYPL